MFSSDYKDDDDDHESNVCFGDKSLQGDPSGSSQPPIDFKTKVPFWPFVLKSTGGCELPDGSPCSILQLVRTRKHPPSWPREFQDVLEDGVEVQDGFEEGREDGEVLEEVILTY